jgi:hypothetical protein
MDVSLRCGMACKRKAGSPLSVLLQAGPGGVPERDLAGEAGMEGGEGWRETKERGGLKRMSMAQRAVLEEWPGGL